MTAMAGSVGCGDRVSSLASVAVTPVASVQRRGVSVPGSLPPAPPPSLAAALLTRSAYVTSSSSASCPLASHVSRRVHTLSSSSSPHLGGGSYSGIQAAALTQLPSSSISGEFRGRKRGWSGHVSDGFPPSAARIVCLQAVEELPGNLQKIVRGFQAVQDPMARYQQLLFYATKLEPLPEELHTTEYKVKGCVSQVWVVPTLRDDGTVHFQADSDSALTKGLAALLVEGLNGSRPEEIIKITPDFIELLGLKQKLTPSRNNGFLNMLKTMQKLTLELYMEAEGRKKAGVRDAVGEVVAMATVNGSAGSSSGEERESSESGSRSDVERAGEQSARQSVAVGAVASSDRPVYESMKRKIEASLRPVLLEIKDQSSEHAGHAGVASSSAKETHFTVKVISEEFEGKTSVKRHRLIYDLLEEEFKDGLHALSLVTKAPSEV